MHTEILSADQRELLPIIKLFRKEFYLVGGTAIALQLGHRRSVDFDLFTSKPFGSKRILNAFEKAEKKVTVTRRVSEQLNLSVDGVKMTFFEYPYAVDADVSDMSFRMPELLSLAAMKALALGRRSKWKGLCGSIFPASGHVQLERNSTEGGRDFFRRVLGEVVPLTARLPQRYRLLGTGGLYAGLCGSRRGSASVPGGQSSRRCALASRQSLFAVRVEVYWIQPA
jgi:hypothetical protein